MLALKPVHESVGLPIGVTISETKRAPPLSVNN